MTSVDLFLFNYQDYARSNGHKICVVCIYIMLSFADTYLSPSYRALQIYHQSFFDADPQCSGLRNKCGPRLKASWDGVVMYSLRCACSCDVIDYSMPDVHMVVSKVGGPAGE